LLGCGPAQLEVLAQEFPHINVCQRDERCESSLSRWSVSLRQKGCEFAAPKTRDTHGLRARSLRRPGWRPPAKGTPGDSRLIVRSAPRRSLPLRAMSPTGAASRCLAVSSAACSSAATNKPSLERNRRSTVRLVTCGAWPQLQVKPPGRDDL
jgi:hypothetical protein